MVQIFTRNHPSGGSWGSATAGGFGAFHQGWGEVNVGTQINPDFAMRVNGSIALGGGWQQRTDFTREQLRISFDNTFGRTKMTNTVMWLRDTNFWGSPQPVDAGQPVPGFEDPDENFAVQGARVDHHVIGLFNNIQTPLSSTVYFENILGVTNDNQGQIRSWVTAVDGNVGTSEGIALYPKETVVYDDAHIVAAFNALGQHRLVGGAALTWGQTNAAGHGFDFDFQIDPQVIPVYGTFPFGDNRNFKDTPDLRRSLRQRPVDAGEVVHADPRRPGGLHEGVPGRLSAGNRGRRVRGGPRREQRQPLLVGRLRDVPHRGPSGRRADRA